MPTEVERQDGDERKEDEEVPDPPMKYRCFDKVQGPAFDFDGKQFEATMGGMTVEDLLFELSRQGFTITPEDYLFAGRLKRQRRYQPIEEVSLKKKSRRSSLLQVT